mgnify:CR=1 FL=1
MIIGVPIEIKENENRVSMTPYAVRTLINDGHEVIVQESAGVKSGFSNDEYTKFGARIVGTLDEVYQQSDMIVKVKEPQEAELSKIRESQIVFTYFHFAASKKLTESIVDSKCVAIAYETVQTENKNLPLLVPMSEIAGRLSVHNGAKCLESNEGGRGVLLSGSTGIEPATVTIIGGGIVGSNACKLAAGLGAKVNILDVNVQKLQFLSDVMPPNVTTLYSDSYKIERLLPQTDLLIGAVLVVGAKAPNLISKSMLGFMKKGSVIIDVAVDQGGCFETTKPTTHSDPTYIIDDVLHYSVANMPGAVPMTSTEGLTNATINYAIEIANKGWKQACIENNPLKKGLNIVRGDVVYQAVAEAFNMKYTKLNF